MFEQILGDRERQGSLAWCSSWGRRVRHDLATEQQQISGCSMGASHSAGFSYYGALLEAQTSVVATCGLSFPEACGICLPGPGIKLVSPALTGDA